jgi:2-succinyl-5-enolpyruvyl-6-hydroxy-3-cyclohexene-1-carboxylate synthase
VINNGGGNIFRWIDGPKDESVLEHYFESPFAESMEGSALQLGVAYAVAENWQQFDESFDSWYNNDGPSLLEIKTKGIEAAGFYNALKTCLNLK